MENKIFKLMPWIMAVSLLSGTMEFLLSGLAKMLVRNMAVITLLITLWLLLAENIKARQTTGEKVTFTQLIKPKGSSTVHYYLILRFRGLIFMTATYIMVSCWEYRLLQITNQAIFTFTWFAIVFTFLSGLFTLLSVASAVGYCRTKTGDESNE